MKKFLIGLLGNYGDCLYGTTIAKQIKTDYPDAHITWAVSSKYKSIIENNPLIDQVWEVPFEESIYEKSWEQLKTEAKDKKKKGVFNHLIFCQIPPDNWHRYDGTIRGTILNSYNDSITVSVDPIIQVTEQEQARVRDFVLRHNISKYQHVILFEAAPTSHQSDFNINTALQVSESLIKANAGVCCIISSPQIIQTSNDHIFDASSLTFIENAELMNYCSLLVGCSSGITWLSTSNWVKQKINTIQVLKESFYLYAGMIYDHAKWNLNTEHIIEVTESKEEYLFELIDGALKNGFSNTKNKYNKVLRPDYHHFRKGISLIKQYNKKWQVIPYLFRFYKKNKHLSRKDLFLYYLLDNNTLLYNFLMRVKKIF